MRVITIGRGDGNDIMINDSHASRHHMQIIKHDDGHYTLSDFGSTNGTFVNGQRINGEVPLSPNDVVRIGNTTLPWRNYFDVPPSQYPPSAPPMKVDYIVERRRNWFVTLWLILLLIVGAIRIVTSSIGTAEAVEYFRYIQQTLYICLLGDIAVILLILGAILLLAWKKAGFWLYCSNSALNLIASTWLCSIAGANLQIIGIFIWALLGPIVLWAILQISKNGIRCWKHLH